MGGGRNAGGKGSGAGRGKGMKGLGGVGVVEGGHGELKGSFIAPC